MARRTLVPDPGEVVLEHLKLDGPDQLVMVLRAAGKGQTCPVCQRRTAKIHSRYRRQLSDLPWQGIPVRIELRVRRFFCVSDDCRQRIFAERLPGTVKPYGRRTLRLSELLGQIGMALGGAAGTRLSRQFGIEASEPTVLRQLRASRAERATPEPRVVGIDDWAWRKGHRYDSILCDLERGRVIDMLADRSSASTEEWLRRHPGIEIVSRDRASLYAEAASKALPHAVQITDRWHLLHNLSEALVNTLAPHHRLINEVARAVYQKVSPPPPVSEPPEIMPAVSCSGPAKKHNRERRLALYETAMQHLRQGETQAATARMLGLDRRTIRRWSRARAFPERKAAHRTSAVDAYGPYLRQRWDEGCHNASHLWRELRDRGFSGQAAIVRIWVRRHCRPRGKRHTAAATAKPPPASPRSIAWLILKDPEESRPYLDEVFRRSPEIASSAAAAREFARMIRDRDAAAWHPWLTSAAQSPLAGFARHLRRDESAVLAALTTRWSNGPVEGHVHRLKLIKRSMYGRARFDLLRIRVLGRP